MPPRKAVKRVQLLRAAFLQVADAGTTLQQVLQNVVAALPKIAGEPDLDVTAIDSVSHGRLRINEQRRSQGALEVKVVALAPGERATTVPIQLGQTQQVEDATAAPAAAAFKGGDFFMLVLGNNVLSVGDHLRLGAVERYVHELVMKVLPNAPEAAAFEISPVARKNKVKMLASEGIKEIELNSTLYSATIDQLDPAVPLYRAIRSATGGIWESVKAIFEEDETEELNEHLGEIQVKLSIRVKGGLRGDEVARETVEELGKSLVSNGEPAEDEDVSPVLVTNRNNRVSLTEASISETFLIKRRTNENSLRDADVWAALRSYRATLQQEGALDT